MQLSFSKTLIASAFALAFCLDSARAFDEFNDTHQQSSNGETSRKKTPGRDAQSGRDSRFRRCSKLARSVRLFRPPKEKRPGEDSSLNEKPESLNTVDRIHGPLDLNFYYRDLGSQKHSTLDPFDGLPMLAGEKGRRVLLSDFPSMSAERRALAIRGIVLGERLYTDARLLHGLSALPPNLSDPANKPLHPYWENGVQAAVVTAAHNTVEEIAVVSALMVYFLHDVDDIADTLLADFLVNLDWQQVATMPVPEFLRRYIHPGYDLVYQDLVHHVLDVIPDFDVNLFEKALIRMIRGSVLSPKYIPEETRKKFQVENLEGHLEALRKTHLGLYIYCKSKITPDIYALTVKTLPDGIYSFFGKDFDHGLIMSFGLLASPGVLLQDYVEEMEAGEAVAGELPGRLTIIETLRGWERALIRGIQRGEFKKAELKKFQLILLAYGDAFRNALGSRFVAQHDRFMKRLDDLILSQ